VSQRHDQNLCIGRVNFLGDVIEICFLTAGDQIMKVDRLRRASQTPEAQMAIRLMQSTKRRPI
jgi:hypothetical protein